MKTNKNLFFVHNIFAITTKKNLFLFVFTCFFCFFFVRRRRIIKTSYAELTFQTMKDLFLPPLRATPLHIQMERRTYCILYGVQIAIGTALHFMRKIQWKVSPRIVYSSFGCFFTGSCRASASR